MLFTSATFALFFVLYYTLHHFVLRTPRQRMLAIVVGSLIFYGHWNYRLIPLLVFVGISGYWFARAIERAGTDRVRRKRLLLASLFVQIGLLAFFKYTNFVVSNAIAAGNALGLSLPPLTFDIILPVGISFYTFQAMSYTIDVYRGAFGARGSVIDCLASVSFFPHLVAGPILRASHIIPQFESAPRLMPARMNHAILLIAAGLAKKAVADMIGGWVDPIFAIEGHVSLIDAWTGAIGFTAQMYADFAGYSDIAIGTAALLGFDIPDNFRLPFLSRSLPEFWQRWHISLSLWIRDYLFFSMAKKSAYLSLMVSWLVMGLWHGASWNFVLWGIYHGTLLVITQLVRTWLRRSKRVLRGAAWSAIGVAATFYFAVMGFVMSRTQTRFGDLWVFLRDMHLSSGAKPTDGAAIVFACMVVALVGCHALDYAVLRLKDAPRPRLSFAIAVLLFAVGIGFGASGKAFIYFQF